MPSERDEMQWQPARLLPVSGIRGKAEYERRTTSAFLAVLTTVHEFNRALLKTPAGSRSVRLWPSRMDLAEAVDHARRGGRNRAVAAGAGRPVRSALL